MEVFIWGLGGVQLERWVSGAEACIQGSRERLGFQFPVIRCRVSVLTCLVPFRPDQGGLGRLSQLNIVQPLLVCATEMVSVIGIVVQ